MKQLQNIGVPRLMKRRDVFISEFALIGIFHTVLYFFLGKIR